MPTTPALLRTRTPCKPSQPGQYAKRVHELCILIPTILFGLLGANNALAHADKKEPAYEGKTLKACPLLTFLENPRPESAHFVPSLTRLFCEPLELATLLVRQALEEGEHTTDGDTSGGDDG